MKDRHLAAAAVAATAAALATAVPATAATVPRTPGLTAAARTAGTKGPVPCLGYWPGANFGTGVSSVRVCDRNPSQHRACTGWYTSWPISPGYQFFLGSIGSHQWRRGRIEVFWNGGSPGHRDYCNTNGDYPGYLCFGARDYVALGAGTTLLGEGQPEC